MFMRMTFKCIRHLSAVLQSCGILADSARHHSVSSSSKSLEEHWVQFQPAIGGQLGLALVSHWRTAGSSSSQPLEDSWVQLQSAIGGQLGPALVSHWRTAWSSSSRSSGGASPGHALRGRPLVDKLKSVKRNKNID